MMRASPLWSQSSDFMMLIDAVYRSDRDRYQPQGGPVPTSTGAGPVQGLQRDLLGDEAADREAEHINLLQSQRLDEGMALAPNSSNGSAPHPTYWRRRRC
jgi:hypothetical protein